VAAHPREHEEQKFMNTRLLKLIARDVANDSNLGANIVRLGTHAVKAYEGLYTPERG
jgi:hypothetical protein